MKFTSTTKKLLVCLVALSFLVAFFGISSAAEPQFKMRLAQVHPVDSDYDLRAKEFAKKVFEGTNGRIQIDVFSGGVLGDWTEIFEMVQRGTIEMSMAQANANFDPQLNLAYYFPYIVTNAKEAQKVYGPDGWAYKIIQDLWAKHNIKALAVIPIGMSGVSLNKVPEKFAEPGASHGLKVRVMPIKPCEWTYEALGYIATPIPYAEAYSAIQTGIADGQMGGPPFQAWQFKDVNKVWIQYNDFFESWWFAINMDLWNKISKEDQDVMLKAAQEESDVQWARAEEADEEYRQKLVKEYGWEIVMLTQEQLDAVAAHVRKVVWPKMEEIVGKDLMDRIYKESGIAR
ncbi:TRAP-type C4-dicarboxylate transport system substrate-binding protein [Aminivibrio pyruvatiphilus]|jgi:TRAP-type C4-dicarboxylate transport system substrate-binding protein|uniref:TRAP-type C4-dicarboxylate transport system substrate-binding protein n=1 Tax=Aminivibrio pyruvatiphilus TaxID=1005740 RepID=A0A4V3HFP7_9BACT|nr:TRAP transporter substrate-binding protein DctP [Aminivibrio pyruvatiphilus]TDY54527.1 TRAP-type C4-dicarboxylate transport system substrate-binding protein [Aminivibrio pyruvatiphilus]